MLCECVATEVDRAGACLARRLEAWTGKGEEAHVAVSCQIERQTVARSAWFRASNPGAVMQRHEEYRR